MAPAARPTKPTPKKTSTRATGSARKTSTAATRAVDWGAKFLAELAKRGNVKDACAAAQIHRSTAYDRKQADPAFAALWADALEESADVLEREAWRRAHDGLVRKKFTKDGDPINDPATGQQYYERDYSDTLLIFLLKGARPDKYREKHEIVGKGGGPIKTARELSDEELAAIAAGAVTGHTGPGSAGTAQSPART